jgi:hypothetical protein
MSNFNAECGIKDFYFKFKIIFLICVICGQKNSIRRLYRLERLLLKVIPNSELKILISNLK